uniref:Interferon lambda 4 n=1 Tax=Gorilla gorilla gorilla TaxID=9595 RepID=A0A2I2Z6S6_GORGO
MRPSVWAAVAAGLWVVCTVVAAAPRRCLLSHYRSLEPRTLAAAKALRDRYEEEALSWGQRNCSFRPRRDPPRPSVRPGSGRERHGPRADAEGASSFAFSICLMSHLQLELARPAPSRKVPGAQRRRHKPRRADSPRCREASVIFNLLRLLTWELRLAAHSGPCL